MTRDRREFITNRFTRWLARFEPRRAIRDKKDLVADELNALLGLVLKAAPKNGYEAWLEDMLERLDRTMLTSAWPTTGQLAGCLQAPRPTTGASSLNGTGRPEWKPDAQSINERRILARDPVSEHVFWGRGADELLARGRITTADLEPYRKYMISEWTKLHNEEYAVERVRGLETGRPVIGSPVDGTGSGSFTQIGAAPSVPDLPWYHDTGSQAYQQRLRELGRRLPEAETESEPEEQRRIRVPNSTRS